MANVKEKLTKPPGKETKCRIGRGFFGAGFDNNGGLQAFEDYFRYYEEEIDLMQRGITPETDQLTGIAAKTHDDLITIARVLRESEFCMKGQVREKLREYDELGQGEDWSFDRAIDITMRLWLQINIREDDSGLGGPTVRWNETTTLKTFMASLFPVADWELGAKERRLDPYFTGANMVGICGLTIAWTNSLEDHLRLERREKILWVYPHKRTLQALLSQAQNCYRTPIPSTVLKETIQTLDLLFPFWDERTKVFLNSEGQTFHDIIGPIEHGRTLNFLDFAHWKDRLFEVYEEVYQSPPVSWAQLRKDRRNPQQFYTFWIALIILGLTLISTFTGIVSMITSIVQMNLAIRAFQDQACSASSGAERK